MQILTVFAVAGLVATGVSTVASPAPGGEPRQAGVAPQARPQVPPTTPPRDVRATATATIRGRVMAVDTKAPLRRVRLALKSPALSQDRVTSTDLEGRFEFTELPAGRYRLLAAKGAYVPIEYGQRRPSQPGRAIELADAQVLEKVDLVLSRGAVIAGQVVDDLNEPAAFVRVSAMRRIYSEGRPRLASVGHVVETNDIGQYRLFGLAPGSYYVGASGTVWTAGSASSPETFTSAPSYYPGTMNVADARRISVGLGEERGGTDIAMLPIRAVRVSGTAFDSRGRPVDVVRLLSLDPIGGIAMTGGIGAGTPVKADGTFTVSNVAPGEYVLTALARNDETGDTESAGQRVWVSGEEIGGLAVITTRGVRVTGRIVQDGGRAPSLSTSAVGVWSEPAGDLISGSVGGVGRIAGDWTFELRGVAGQRLVKVRLPSGWALKSILLDGRDITDSGLDVGGTEDIGGLQVIITNRISEVSGQVTGEDGRPVSEYSVVVFPPDPSRWTGPSRFMATARPDQYGRFKLSALPAGEYLAIAVDYLDEGESWDPDFLERVRGTATKLTVGEGETKSIDLRLVKRDAGR